MKLAKNHIDVGLFSHRREEQLAFWQQTVGLPFDHIGKLGGGVQQHRHHMNGSILKINHTRDPLPAAPASAILELRIARSGLPAAQSLVDPDGNRVMLVPPVADGVVGICVVLKVSDLVASDDFYVNAMGCLRRARGRLALRRHAIDRGRTRPCGKHWRVARARLSLSDCSSLGLYCRTCRCPGSRRYRRTPAYRSWRYSAVLVRPRSGRHLH